MLNRSHSPDLGTARGFDLRKRLDFLARFFVRVARLNKPVIHWVQERAFLACGGDNWQLGARVGAEWVAGAVP